MEYAITITRFNGEDGEILIDKYVSAVAAIDLMILTNQLAVESEATEEVETEDENVEEEAATEETPEPPRPSRTGRGTTYDKDALIADLKADILSTAEIASKHQVTTATGYQVKHKLRKSTEVIDDTPGETEYARKQRERAENPGPEVNIEGEIRLAAIQGFSLSEISDMYPTVPLETISKIREPARD